MAIDHLLARGPEGWTVHGDVIFHAETRIFVTVASKYGAVHRRRDRPHSGKADPRPIEDRRHSTAPCRPGGKAPTATASRSRPRPLFDG
jgi:hypothetical protein